MAEQTLQDIDGESGPRDMRDLVDQWSQAIDRWVQRIDQGMGRATDGADPVMGPEPAPEGD